MIHSGIPQRKRRAEPEFQMQAALFTWARNPAVLKKYPALALLEGSLNGVKLTAAQAGKAKAAGMLKGAHDVTLPVARGMWTGLSIELKAGKNKPTEEQIEYGQRLAAEGWRICFVWDDWEAAMGEIVDYLSHAPHGSISKPPEKTK